MASLVLTVVGTAVAGPFGGLVGGLVGTYLDQAFIFPAIFGRPSGPRLEDLHVQTAAEGSSGRLVLGPKNRTAGTLIWASDFIEEEHSDKKGPTYYTYTVHVAIAIGEGPIRQVRRVWADSKVIYDRGEMDGRVGDIRFYTGTTTQTADPLIEASDPGNTPAYRGTAYVVIESLDITDWGNRLPNFSFEVEGDKELPVQDAIVRIAERAGLLTDEVDTDRVPGCLRGYIVLGPQETLRILDPLMTAFSLGARDDNGVLTFWKRGEEDNYGTLVSSEMGAVEAGQEASTRVVKITDTREFQLPSQVTVQHVDPDWDLQQGSQRERRINASNTDVVSLTLPLTLSVDEARSLAKTLIWSGYAERQLVEFDLPPSHIRLQEGDVLTIPLTDDTQATVRVVDIGRGYNHVLKVRGHVTDLGTYDQSSSVDARTGGGTVTPPTPLTWYILDIPALTSNHQQVLGFYVASAFRRISTTWRGARGFKSSDNVDFDAAWTHQRESAVGVTTSVLENVNASSLWWDNQNTVEVLMYEGTLASASEANVLNGSNRILIGDEIVGFTTATLIGDRAYRLSGLLRGLRNTEEFIDGHTLEERVVLLNTGTLVFYTGIEQSDIGAERYYKDVPVGASMASAPVQTVTPAAGTLRHFSPAHLTALHSTTNDDCEISWVRRSRALVAPFPVGDAPLLDSAELYDLEIRFARGTILRTERVTSATEFVYTEAMQTADGLTPGTDGFFVYVYQVSTLAGRSNPAVVHYDPTV